MLLYIYYILDISLVNTDELIRDVKTTCSLGCNDHAPLITFLIDT